MGCRIKSIFLMKLIRISLFTGVFVTGAAYAFAQQKPQKITFTGAARGQFYADHFSNAGETDTVTTAKTNSGHVMADVGVHIRPNDAMEIQGMVRVRIKSVEQESPYMTVEVEELVETVPPAVELQALVRSVQSQIGRAHV